MWRRRLGNFMAMGMGDVSEEKEMSTKKSCLCRLCRRNELRTRWSMWRRYLKGRGAEMGAVGSGDVASSFIEGGRVEVGVGVLE